MTRKTLRCCILYCKKKNILPTFFNTLGLLSLSDIDDEQHDWLGDDQWSDHDEEIVGQSVLKLQESLDLTENLQGEDSLRHISVGASELPNLTQVPLFEPNKLQLLTTQSSSEDCTQSIWSSAVKDYSTMSLDPTDVSFPSFVQVSPSLVIHKN